VRRKKDKSRPDIAAPGLPAFTDQAGNHVWLLAEPRIIRRSISSPTSSNQSFYYNLLLDHIATRAERDIVPLDRDYFRHCIACGIFTTTAALDEHLLRYAEYNLWDEVKLNNLRQRVTTSLADAEALGAMDDGDLAGSQARHVLLDGIAAMEGVLGMNNNQVSGYRCPALAATLHSLRRRHLQAPAGTALL
jgi:hypothetical protein